MLFKLIKLCELMGAPKLRIVRVLTCHSCLLMRWFLIQIALYIRNVAQFDEVMRHNGGASYVFLHATVAFLCGPRELWCVLQGVVCVYGTTRRFIPSSKDGKKCGTSNRSAPTGTTRTIRSRLCGTPLSPSPKARAPIVHSMMRRLLERVRQT